MGCLWLYQLGNFFHDALETSRIDSRLEGEARISHPWRGMMQVSALTESPVVRPQRHFLRSARHRLSYKGKGSILQNQKRNCSKVGWFFNNRGKIMQPWSTWERHSQSTEKVQNIIAKKHLLWRKPATTMWKHINCHGEAHVVRNSPPAQAPWEWAILETDPSAWDNILTQCWMSQHPD